MDLAAVALPAGFRPNGLPFGITIVGPTGSDEALLQFASRIAEPTRAGLGRNDTQPLVAPGCVAVAVVGAHLTGQPLNRQLIERNARLLRSTRTSPQYRLFALTDAVPPKPGLLRDDSYEGRGIAVEVWSVPLQSFGTFVASVPPPLAIGTIQLESGEWVKGFICEPRALEAATEITSFGGWKAYRAALVTA
jgi:allophanate hydrolase